MAAQEMQKTEVQRRLRMYHQNADVSVGQTVWVRITDAKGMYEMPVLVVEDVIVVNDKISVAALKEYFENDQTALNIIDAQVVEIDGVAHWYDGEHGIATIETVEKEAREAEETA